MSWLVSSLANSLNLDDDDDPNPKSTNVAAANSADKPPPETQNPNNVNNQQNSSSLPDQIDSPRGVKQDLSEISKTLTRQFWGVASFLAPPPSQISDRDRKTEDSGEDSGDPDGTSGIRNDLSEIGGKFRTGISKLSSNKAVSEFTKMASNLLQFASEEDLSLDEYAQRGVVGMTEEVLAFAKDIALHPKTWLDFPLPDDDDERDFDLSDAQQEHALAVERLTPELAALRVELCLGYMSEAWFWKIYFVLVHPVLSKHDAEILSTPEIMRARALLGGELPSDGKQKLHDESAESAKLSLEGSVPVIDKSESVQVEVSPVEPADSVEADIEIDKHSVKSTSIPVIDKAVVGEVSKNQTNIEKATPTPTPTPTPMPSGPISVEHNDEDDADDWLKEEHEGDSSKGTSYQAGNDDDDDITFSDLEEEDEMPSSSRKLDRVNDKAGGDNTIKKKGSNDWLDIEDIDVA